MLCSIRQVKNKNKAKLTVTYDMGWQKIFSGRRYDSYSDNVFIIRRIPNLIIGMDLYSKACQNCDTKGKRE